MFAKNILFFVFSIYNRKYLRYNSTTITFLRKAIMSFFVTLSAVATLLLYAVPAYMLGKFKIAKAEHIPLLAAILLYVCTPVIIVNSFQKMDFNVGASINLLIFLILATLIHIVTICTATLIFKKNFEKMHFRIASIATTLGNCGFFGIPLLEALLPENPEAVIYSAVFSIAMNTIAFTLGALIITGDKKYIKAKKVFLNPSTVGTFVAIPLFLLNIKFPVFISDVLDVLARIGTPICMFVFGLRLSYIKISRIFPRLGTYLIAILGKQIIMPLIAIAVTAILPCDPIMESALIIMCSCPVASIVLNLSELLGEGQTYAADCVLTGTLLSIITIPIMMLIL